jgi:hypothetical protein
MQKWHLRAVFILFLALMLNIVPAAAQRRLKFRTLEMGLGPAMASLHDNDPNTNRIPKPSFAVSGGLVHSLKRNLFITNHVMYELKGGEALQNFPDTESPPKYYNYSLSYLTVAPGVRRYLRTNGSVFLEGGPFISFLLVSNKVRLYSVNPFSSFDAGMSLSIGYTPKRKDYKGLTFRLVNNTGFKDVGLDTGWKEWTNSLSLIVGIRIRMR